MAGIEEIVTALQTAIDELERSIGATTGAESDTEQMVSQLSGIGMVDAAQALSGAKDAIETARIHLSGGTDLLENAINAVKAASG